MRIIVDTIPKEISTHRTWKAARWNVETGRASVKKNKTITDSLAISINDQALALNAYLDTVQAKVFEAKHRLIESGKPVTAEAIKNLLQGRGSTGERPHTLLEIFQYHNDQVKAKDREIMDSIFHVHILQTGPSAASFGAWAGSETGDEIVAGLKASRTFNKQIEI